MMKRSSEKKCCCVNNSCRKLSTESDCVKQGGKVVDACADYK
jgi:hypothetical protein